MGLKLRLKLGLPPRFALIGCHRMWDGAITEGLVRSQPRLQGRGEMSVRVGELPNMLVAARRRCGEDESTLRKLPRRFAGCRIPKVVVVTILLWY